MKIIYLSLLKEITKKLDTVLESLGHKTKSSRESLVHLNRHQLGSIDLSDLTIPEELTGERRKEYLQQAELLWANPVFQNETKLIIRKQLEFIGMQAVEDLQYVIGRGTINGSDLLRDRIETLHTQYKESIKGPDEPVDSFAITP